MEQENEEAMINEDPEIMDEEEMLDDENDDDTNPLTSINAFKKLIVGILEDNDLSQKRAAKMEIIDFLSLLSLFNGKGVHFT